MEFKLDGETFNEGKEVYKNILWLYQDAVSSYGAFGHNLDFEEIDYMKYFFTYTDDEVCFGHLSDVICNGSLVALCCEVQNLLDEEQRPKRVFDNIRNLLQCDLIEKRKYDKHVLVSMIDALNEERRVDWENGEYGKKLSVLFNDVYQKYILGYYEGMLQQGHLIGR